MPPPSGITVLTMSGHRQTTKSDSADLRSWEALAEQLGTAWCLWAGPPLRAVRGPIHVTRRPRHPGPRSVFWALRTIRDGVRISRAAARRRETVIVNGGEPWGWLSAWMVARIVRRPWLMDIHADYLGLPIASLGRWRKLVLEKAVVWFARRADGRRVVAQSMVDALAQTGIRADLVPPRLQPIWQEAVQREHPPFQGADWTILTVGRLVRSKGLDVLLDAVALLVTEKSTLRLRIVGDGPELAHLKAQAAQRDVSENVVFVGSAGVDVIREELARADIFVISSRDEGLPRTLLEAAAAAVPIVATAVGGIPAAAGAWPTVSLVPVDDAAIAAAVRAVAMSPPPPDHLRAVSEEVIANYGFAHNIAALARLYHLLADESSTAAVTGDSATVLLRHQKRGTS